MTTRRALVARFRSRAFLPLAITFSVGVDAHGSDSERGRERRAGDGGLRLAVHGKDNGGHTERRGGARFRFDALFSATSGSCRARQAERPRQEREHSGVVSGEPSFATGVAEAIGDGQDPLHDDHRLGRPGIGWREADRCVAVRN
jgi:hypothetical protein